MSATFNAAAQALSEDPALRNKVMSAGTAEERAAILREAGVAVPTHADVNAAHADMAGVAGGGGYKTGTIADPIVSSAPAAAGASAA